MVAERNGYGLNMEQAFARLRKHAHDQNLRLIDGRPPGHRRGDDQRNARSGTPRSPLLSPRPATDQLVLALRRAAVSRFTASRNHPVTTHPAMAVPAMRRKDRAAPAT
ncbi:MAG: hypothetical protein ACRDV9_07360 [Acidimicrobiia bacterium]